MTPVELQTPDAAIARIDDWSDLDVSWETLGGGITNRNYVVTVSDDAGAAERRYVLRVPGAGTDTFIDRQHEHHNHMAAAQAEVAPPVLYTLEPEMITVVPFIDGETMHPESFAGHHERLAKAVRAIRTYHERAVFANEARVFDQIRRYVDLAFADGAPLPDEVREALNLAELIERAMARDEPQPTGCHNDLLSENFILGADGTMWVIDWEYSGRNDPYYDLGVFCAENRLPEADERFILTCYCGRFEPARYARMMLFKLVSDLWWGLWALNQVRLSTIDFDYHQYGIERIMRFRANASTPELATWLATV